MENTKPLVSGGAGFARQTTGDEQRAREHTWRHATHTYDALEKFIRPCYVPRRLQSWSSANASMRYMQKTRAWRAATDGVVHVSAARRPAGRLQREIYRAGNGRRQSLRGSSWPACCRLLCLRTTRRATEPDSSVRCTFVSCVFALDRRRTPDSFFPSVSSTAGGGGGCRFSRLVWRNQLWLSWLGRGHVFLLRLLLRHWAV